MAVIAFTDNPAALLRAVTAAIDGGEIRTWSYDIDGDFTHTAEQYVRRAWLRPRLSEDRLILNIFPPRGRNLSRAIYGIYHGRFIEMLLTHFDRSFSKAVATAMPTSSDRVR